MKETNEQEVSKKPFDELPQKDQDAYWANDIDRDLEFLRNYRDNAE